MWSFCGVTTRSSSNRNHTMSDIARLAGVSPMTVSRVVNGDARVRAATREKVEAVIRETGYVPDPAARILARAGGGWVDPTPMPTRSQRPMPVQPESSLLMRSCWNYFAQTTRIAYLGFS